MPRLSSRPTLLRALFAAALAAFAAPLAGCHDFGDVTGSIPASATQPTDDAKLRAYANELGKRYDRNPGDKTASIEYARALRALTRYNEAVAVIQTAAIKTPKDFDVLGEYGKALADAGQLAQAKDVLSHAYTPDDPRRHVGAGDGRRPARGPRRRDAVLPRGAEDLARRAKRADQHGALARSGEKIARG
jgi:Flp pilus assembly protein TadD